MTATRWDDLRTRIASAVLMVAPGLAALTFGGIWFHLLIALVCALMVWELVCLLDTHRTKSQYALAGATFVCALAAAEVPPAFGLPLLLVPSMLGFGRMERGGVTYAVYTALILLAGYGMMALRDNFGFVWMLWLIVVVVATDVAGYFAGKALGGPKFWPKVSPNKTWSGTAGGWVAAGITGFVFALVTGTGMELIGVSVALAMAAQIGDIAESAMKRQAGAKDSSALIPGHGGLLDRFDGMLAAAVFLVVVGQIVNIPPGAAG